MGDAAGHAIGHHLDILSTGLAIAGIEDWAVRHANAAFDRLLPAGEPGDALTARVPGLDGARARRRLAERGSHLCEATVRSGGRERTLAVELRAVGGDAVLVEVRDESKRRQAEYMLDSYSRMAERNARELENERARAERLLLNVVPRSVLREMREFGTVMPQRFDCASVLMLDFVGFTEMAVAREPAALVAELNDIYSAFDRIAEMFQCERIKTNGDSYMAVSGVPEPDPDHAGNIARAALRMRRFLEHRNASNTNRWLARIGVASGPLVGSVVGVSRFVYDIFGPAVNLAARLEALSEPMQISIGEGTLPLLEAGFATEPRGAFEVKGFGRQIVHTLVAGAEPATGASGDPDPARPPAVVL